MTRFKVEQTDTVVFTYEVEARNEFEARKKISTGQAVMMASSQDIRTTDRQFKITKLNFKGEKV